MTTANAPSSPTVLALGADRLVLAALLVSCVAALPIGWHFGQLALAATGAAAIAAAGLVVYALSAGRLASRLLLGSLLMGSVALHIQAGRGMIEFHFGVFVTLALLLCYRDWRPIIAAAALIAVHHVAFDRLQAAGFGVFCTTSANFGVVVLHAVYVVLQSAAELYIVSLMQRLARQGEELAAIVDRVDADGRISLDVQGLKATTPLAGKLQRMLGRIDGALHTVGGAAAQIRLTAQEIAQGSTDLSQRTEDTAASLQRATGTMSGLAEQVRHSAEAAAVAHADVGAAAQAAERGGEVMGQVVSRMQDISTASHRIADIISVIDGIAFQTNILALNAAVEAARAGEQGRGFAVVAGEVRSLAGRSAEAAREIKALIGNSVEQVASGVELVQGAGATMDEIVASVRRVSSVIGEITAATADQSAGIGEVSASVAQLDEATQRNAALVEQSSAAAQSMSDEARRLAEAVAGFELAR